jgi:hypothetical protein
MRPFNLEEALAGKPVVMRNGDRVKAIYFIKEFVKRPVLAIPDYEDEGTDSQFVSENGSFNNDGKEYDWDLFMHEEPWVYYANVYKSNNGVVFVGSTLFDSKEDAESLPNKTINYVKTIEITIS